MKPWARVVLLLATVVALSGLAWAVWQLHLGPTTTWKATPGARVALVSGLGTATVPAGWSCRVTVLRSDPVSWLQFKMSKTLSRQVVEMRSGDGLTVVILDVTRGPGAWRKRIVQARMDAKTRNANPFMTQFEHTAPSDADGSGGRKSISIAWIERVRDSWGMRLNLFVWDPRSPAVLSFSDDHPSARPSQGSESSLGLRAVEFSRVRD